MVIKLLPCNIIDLNSYYGIVKISGGDSMRFLQGQLTCDVAQATEQNAIYGCYCNIKGRVEFNFWLFKYQNDYYLRVVKSLVKYAIQELHKYAVFSKIQVTESKFAFNHYGILGAVNQVLSEVKLPIIYLNYTKLGVQNLHEIFVQDELVITHDLAYWHEQLISHKIPEIHLETKGCFLPHNINLCKLQAVSFTKGCYKGQEIVARMEYLGKIKYGLSVVNLVTSLAMPNIQLKLGEDIYDKDNQIVGKIVNYSGDFALVQQALTNDCTAPKVI